MGICATISRTLLYLAGKRSILSDSGSQIRDDALIVLYYVLWQVQLGLFRRAYLMGAAFITAPIGILSLRRPSQLIFSSARNAFLSRTPFSPPTTNIPTAFPALFSACPFGPTNGRDNTWHFADPTMDFFKFPVREANTVHPGLYPH
jgi:hypothetical protein